MSAKAPGHSAKVRMELRLNGHILPIAELGPNFLVLRTPIDHPAGDAEISLSIDGEEECWPVWLADGIILEKRETKISRCP
ncbi:MAG: hypothetical protein HY040_03115 [Planctomycetes bacterium]|nr:hypothetical protein [Planctomycetota bacterium]